VRLRAVDDMPRHLGDALHELVARELAVLHFLQPVFPLAGELRRNELGNLEAA
jgi:hypothetical protein